MDANSDATETRSAALVGWGMTLLAVGALILASDVSRRIEGDRPGLAVLGLLVLLFGWGLLTGGLVTMARRVDRLSRRDELVETTATDAR
ncbi:hypothetical protein ACOCJ5_03960 [Knoellia sp. CPCC 206450]|uniref:hypothetical protein n=1 Tax=Knoellia tibetensis TaxID=3404798 RepID=UPI003B433EA1